MNERRPKWHEITAAVPQVRARPLGANLGRR